MKKTILLTSIFAITIITSCKKSESTTASKSKSEYLVASPWKQTSVTINPGIVVGGVTITDLFLLMQACQKDDTRKFNTGGSGVMDEGVSKCDPTDPQTTPFTWSLISSDSKLVMNDGSGADTTNVVQLDGSTFKGSQVMDGADVGGTPGTKYTVTMTATH